MLSLRCLIRFSGMFLIACLSFKTAVIAQQKAMYTQYMFNGLAINPAYSATDEALTFTGLARQQWVGLKGAPNTQTFSIHTPIKETNTSVGMILMRDQIGEVISEKGATLTLAQRVEIGEDSYLAVGLNGGFSQNQASFSDNYAQSPGAISDPVFQDQNKIRANFGFGIMLFSPKYYLGFSSPHFYYRDVADIGKLNPGTAYRPHYILQAGYVAPLGDFLKFKPNFIMKYVNGSPMQLDVNVNFLIKEAIWVGASYRSLESFDALAQIYVTKGLAIGYSYDFASTELARVQTGSHEIMLQFRLPVKGRNYPRCYY